MKIRDKHSLSKGNASNRIFLSYEIKDTENYKLLLSKQLELYENLSKGFSFDLSLANFVPIGERNLENFSPAHFYLDLKRSPSYKVCYDNYLISPKGPCEIETYYKKVKSWWETDFCTLEEFTGRNNEAFVTEREKIKQYIRKYEETGNSQFLLLIKKFADEQRKLIFTRLEKADKKLRGLKAKYRLISIIQWVHTIKFNIRNQNRNIGKNTDEEDAGFTFTSVINNVKPINLYSNDPNRKRILC